MRADDDPRDPSSDDAPRKPTPEESGDTVVVRGYDAYNIEDDQDHQNPAENLKFGHSFGHGVVNLL